MMNFKNLFTKKPVELAPMVSAPVEVAKPEATEVLRHFGYNFRLVTCTNRDVMAKIGYKELEPNCSDFRCTVDYVLYKGRKVLRINAVDVISGRCALFYTSTLIQFQEMPGLGWSFSTANTTYVFAHAENHPKGGALSC